MEESEVCDSTGNSFLGWAGVRREGLGGTPRRVADGSCGVGRKASSSSDEGSLFVFLIEGKRLLSRVD